MDPPEIGKATTISILLFIEILYKTLDVLPNPLHLIKESPRLFIRKEPVEIITPSGKQIIEVYFRLLFFGYLF